MTCNILLFLFRIFWEIPQNILGLIIFLYWNITGRIFHSEIIKHTGIVLTITRSDTIPHSLGMFTFLPNMPFINRRLIDRAFGYSVMSLFLGPTYILLIALPHGIWHILKIRCNKFPNIAYHSFYTERLAYRMGVR